MKVLSNTSIPTFAAWGNTAIWQSVGLVGEVFCNVILPVTRNTHCDPSLVEFR
jgi:hypothetical protein